MNVGWSLFSAGVITVGPSAGWCSVLVDSSEAVGPVWVSCECFVKAWIHHLRAVRTEQLTCPLLTAVIVINVFTHGAKSEEITGDRRLHPAVFLEKSLSWSSAKRSEAGKVFQVGGLAAMDNLSSYSRVLVLGRLAPLTGWWWRSVGRSRCSKNRIPL